MCPTQVCVTAGRFAQGAQYMSTQLAQSGCEQAFILNETLDNWVAEYIWTPLNQYDNYIFKVIIKRAFIQVPRCMINSISNNLLASL